MTRPASEPKAVPLRVLGIVAIALGLLVTVGTPTTRAQLTELEGISSKRYIVIDADTGEVFVEHNADEQVPIASLTKVFTTIEALELASLDTTITTKSSDLFGADSTTMGFGPGETFTLRDLLYGMMLPSGNDAAHAIARALGSQEGLTDDQAVANFMDRINQRVKSMGLTNTQLKNPHGLSEDGHYSTARDIAIFTMYALQYPTFQQVIGTSSYSTESGYYITNTNRLLGNYVGIVGGKTGYDDEAGYCLVEVATRDGSTMISVTLDGTAPDVWYQDNAILLDYAFEAKAEREAAGRQITNNRVSYRDPDAAGIIAQSRGGASIGQAIQASPSAVESPQESPLAAVDQSGDEIAATQESNTSSDGRLLATPIVVMIALASMAIAAFCGWMAYRESSRRKAALLLPSRAPSDSGSD
jgi:D-alanyl-D-alanine carboxypeptidase